MVKGERRYVYVLAQNLKEAEGLRDAGCGYESERAAKEARATPSIDPYYRNLMKIFKLAEPETRE